MGDELGEQFVEGEAGAGGIAEPPGDERAQSTLMLVGVPETANVDAPMTLLLVLSISVSFFCDASSTSTVLALSLSASAVG